MRKIPPKLAINYQALVFWAVFVVACAVRLIAFGEIPADINQDEAMTGYDAFSLLKTGADSWGVTHPIYLIGWGSGTSILYALLAKLSFYLFGVSVWALRLPQALMSILSCYVFYRLLRIFCDKKTALVGFFLISIMPWSVMSARWGLDANIAPTFCLLGFYFYCRAVKKPIYLGLSTIFYALTMYAYAGFWVFVGVIVLLQWGYLWFYRQNAHGYILSSVVLFVLLNLPLLVLVLVNYGVVAEYRSAWLSVPKLLLWRGQEVGLNHFAFKLTMLFNVLIMQDDGWLSNMIPAYGGFYLFTPLFMFIGLWNLIKKAKADILHKQFSFALCIIGQIVIGLMYAVCVYAFSNRVSFLFMPLLIAATWGIMSLKPFKWVWRLVLMVYVWCFMLFAHTYFTKYNEMLAESHEFSFSYGLQDALQRAEQLHQQTGADIYLLEERYAYAKVLFLNQVNPYLYQQTVSWLEYPNAFMQAKDFLYYHFMWNVDFDTLQSGQIYIVPKNRFQFFVNDSYALYGNYVVSYKK